MSLVSRKFSSGGREGRGWRERAASGRAPELSVWAVFVTGALLAFCGAAALAGESAPQRQVRVRGQCLRRVTSDRAALVVTAEATDPDLKAATRASTRSYERVREAVQKLGLENLELTTSEYSVQEAREWKKDTSVFKGYRVRMGLRVSTSQVQKIGEVIAVAAREEIRDVGGLTTYLSEERRLREHLACLEEASANARARAEKLAAALGARLGEVLSVSEEEAPSSYRPLDVMTAMKAMDGADTASAPSVEPGVQELAIGIDASFALR